jgi:hypothetical protein
MKNQTQPHNINRFSRGNLFRVLGLCLATTLCAGVAVYAADDAAAQKLLAQAKAKETHAHELRAAASTALQKASDDQAEASVDDRDAKILTAQAMKLMGADENKQKAFKIRLEAHKFSSDAHRHLVEARNSEQKAAQLNKNAEELTKAAAGLKDQPAVASTLEAEAKDDTAKAQTEMGLANAAKYSAEGDEDRAKKAFAAAEKLDPETSRQVAPAPAKPQLAQPRQVH